MPMASSISWLGFIVICHLLINYSGVFSDDRKVYIVYMGDLPKDVVSPSSLHASMLQKVVSPSSSRAPMIREVTHRTASKCLIKSYKRSFNGFAAKLTEEDAKKLSSMEGVVSVFPDKKMELFTTMSWDFIGFPQQVERSPNESDIIVGLIDSGIWPESDSFKDEGFGPPPSKWKGICQTSSNFSCNNKIVGARYYRSWGDPDPKDIDSPRDSDGHGTHTASIAAGGSVSGANLRGFASGTARGGVPSARIAVYKACWTGICYGADVLAAFDDAIADGVDIISVSLGSFSLYYFEDPVSIGAFHAMKNGILTSAAVGNYGHAFISNNWPWSISVAASTIDRMFVTSVLLGNRQAYEGVSINTFEMDGMYPIIYGGDAPNTTGGYSDFDSRFCERNSLDKSLVNGKIVLCDGGLNDGEATTTAGAVGMIMHDASTKDFALSFSLPASYMELKDGAEIYNYYNSTSTPTANIHKSFEIEDEFAPYVASFSSRGPNLSTRDILKPDIAAPGVNILAAWSEATSVTGKEWDTRVVPYNIICGTSMACPHVSGAAAYVKSFNPTWSPAAIKSALMTTASPIRSEINTDLEFAYGSGQLNPLKAAKPGLVYDADETDYVKFLCGEGYSNETIRLITGDDSGCTADTNGTVWDLNYPSFAVSTRYNVSVTRIFTRTVTNVGREVSVYRANVSVPSGLSVQVEPGTLSFVNLGEKQTFTVTVDVPALDEYIISGSLVWDDGEFQVRSPIVAYLY